MKLSRANISKLSGSCLTRPSICIAIFKTVHQTGTCSQGNIPSQESHFSVLKEKQNMLYFLVACQVKPQSQPAILPGHVLSSDFLLHHSQIIPWPCHSTYRAYCDTLLGNTSYRNKQVYLFWSSTTESYDQNYNQHFLDLGKLNSIHCAFPALERKHLYQPSSPVSWFWRFTLAAASQNKVSRLKLQEHQKKKHIKGVSSFLCSAETARSETGGWRDQKKGKGAAHLGAQQFSC